MSLHCKIERHTQWVRSNMVIMFIRVPVFPPSPFVFHVGPSCGFKGSGRLVDCASPVHVIGCLRCPLIVIDVTSGEGHFQSMFSEVPLCHNGQ